jgi:hypothetical protein
MVVLYSTPITVVDKMMEVEPMKRQALQPNWAVKSVISFFFKEKSVFLSFCFP